MFPGFVTLYKKDNKLHLFFFRGLTDNNTFYYNKLDLTSCTYKYQEIKYDDESYEYIFEDNSIKKIKCILRKENNKVDTVILINK